MLKKCSSKKESKKEPIFFRSEINIGITWKYNVKILIVSVCSSVNQCFNFVKLYSIAGEELDHLK